MARTPQVTLGEAALTLRVWLKPRGESQRLKRIVSIPCHCLCMCVRAHVFLYSLALSTPLLIAMISSVGPKNSVTNSDQSVPTPPTIGPNDGTQPVPVEGDVVNTPLRVAAHGKQSLEKYTDACLERSFTDFVNPVVDTELGIPTSPLLSEDGSPRAPGQTGGCSGKVDGDRLVLPVPTSHGEVPANSDGDATASGGDTLGSWQMCPTVAMDAGDTDSGVLDYAGSDADLGSRLRSHLGVETRPGADEFGSAPSPPVVGTDEFGSVPPPSGGGGGAAPETESPGKAVAAEVVEAGIGGSSTGAASAVEVTPPSDRGMSGPLDRVTAEKGSAGSARADPGGNPELDPGRPRCP